MTRYVALFCALAIAISNVMASNQHMICKTVDDVFTDTSSIPYRQISQRTVQGLPGKRGSIGRKGDPGPRGLKGEPGSVDYNVSEVISRTVGEEMSAINEHLAALQKNITELTRNMEGFRCSIPDILTLLYNGTCYSTPHFSSTQSVMRPAAIEACHKIGFRLADIHDRAQQEILESFIRPSIPSSISEIYFWIGMNYDFATNSIQYEAGNHLQADQLKWWPSYPTSAVGNVYTFLGVKHSGDDGIYNYPDSNAGGVLCEKKI